MTPEVCHQVEVLQNLNMSRLSCLTIFMLCFLIANVRCEEDDENFWSRWWSRLSDMWKDFSSAFTEMMEKGMAEAHKWTQQKLEEFKSRMREWLATQSEEKNYEEWEIKNMREAVERLQMPPDEEE